MDTALVIGGTRFIGRHLVAELLDAGYEVALFNRGTRENPFAGDDRVSHVEGDRREDGELRLAARDVDPEYVFDVVAYHPRDVRVACEIFADVEGYVYVSSGAAYGADRIPKREGETPLKACTAEQATDGSMATYGARKAEGDRRVFEAAVEGVRAMSVRPPVVYGPYDYTERFNYWVERVSTHDRVLVPGDGTYLWQLVYAPDVASALRTVAERGEAGEAYNVGDGHAPTLGEWVELIAEARGTDVEVVTAGARELAAADLAPRDFPLYRGYPHLLDLSKLRALGWESTDHGAALAETIDEHDAAGRTGPEDAPDRGTVERVLSVLDTVG